MKRYLNPRAFALLTIGILIGLIMGGGFYRGARNAPAWAATINPAFPGVPVQITTRVSSNTWIPNAQGSGGACVPVGTATPVQILAANNARHSWTAWLDSSSSGTKMRIEPGDQFGASPTQTPSATVGAEVTSSQVAHEEIAPQVNTWAISESGSICVDTSED